MASPAKKPERRAGGAKRKARISCVSGEAAADELLHPDEGHDPLADEEIDDEDQDERREIPDRLDVAPGDEACEEAAAHPQEPHDRPQEGGEHRRPEAQLDRRQKPLQEGARGPVSALLADEVLEDHRPLPAVSHLHADTVDEECRRGHEEGDENGVEQGETDLLLQGDLFKALRGSI